LVKRPFRCQKSQKTVKIRQKSQKIRQKSQKTVKIRQKMGKNHKNGRKSAHEAQKTKRMEGFSQSSQSAQSSS